jgi:autotransporter-associated beta strand protein
VRLTGSATVTGAQTANSLVLVNADTNNDLSVSGGTSLSITSGGVLAPGAGNVVISTPLTTGSINEAIFHVTGQGKLTVGNIINASAAITKGGPGTLELNGAGTTATGAVTVNSGKLLLNAVNGAGTGSVKVWNGATLGGSGSTPGAVTVIRGGSVSPGNSPGTLSTGSVAFEAGANLVIDIEGASSFDMLNVTGQVDLLSDLGSNNWDPTQGATNLVLNVSNLGAGNIGNTFKIINNDGSDLVFGTFSNLVQGSTVTQGTYTFQVDYAGGDGNDVVLTLNSVAVPEPGVVGLLGAGAILALRRRRA